MGLDATLFHPRRGGFQPRGGAVGGGRAFPPACTSAVSTPGPHFIQRQPTPGRRVVRRTDTPRSFNLALEPMSSLHRGFGRAPRPQRFCSRHLWQSPETFLVVTLGVADLPLGRNTPVGGARDTPEDPLMHGTGPPQRTIQSRTLAPRLGQSGLECPSSIPPCWPSEPART